jgi:geranylgeranyl diphosphate synthase, type II
MAQKVTSFEAFAAEWRPEIERELEARLTFPHPLSVGLGEAMRYAVLGPGKRLRPLLCLLACEVCRGDPTHALPAACAVEMIHAFSLVHDDLPCMDDDDLRRGRPTCHKVYGEAMALLAGDALLAHAFTVLTTLPPDSAPACCRELAKATGPDGMTEGQAMDMEGVPGSAGTEYLDALYERKTGALIVAALKMGGLVAGADEQRLSALALFGARLGLAFQIIDDVIDVAGTEETAGKAVGKDAGKGKKTYPHFLGVDGARAKAEAIMDDGLRALAVFGDKAEPLKNLAQTVLHRDR